MGDSLIKINSPYGFTGMTTNRLRELATDGLIHKELRGKYIYYKITTAGLAHLNLIAPKTIPLNERVVPSKYSGEITTNKLFA